MTQHTYAVVLVTLLMVGGGVGTMVSVYIIMRPIMAARKAARMARYEYQAKLVRVVRAYQADTQYRAMRVRECAQQAARLERMR